MNVGGGETETETDIKILQLGGVVGERLTY